MNPDREQMLAGVAVEQRMLDVDGISTSVLEAGDGDPLVLLHGGIECGGIMWSPVIDALSQHHRVIVPDAPGLGESPPMERLDAPSFAKWLTRLLDVSGTTGTDAPTIVAHSLIGSLAARFAATHGERLGQLVVSAAPGVGPYRMPIGLRYAAVRFAIRPSPANAERFDRFALLDLDATKRRDPEWFAAFDRYTRSRASVRSVKRTMNQLISAQTKPIPESDLARIRVPTTLLWGRHDRMVPLRIGEIASERYEWPLHVVDGAAHAPHVEQPERFVDTLEGITAAT
jgi:2-hydroxymuconate-semialdehyde hydrolase